MRTTLGNTIGILALAALSACAAGGTPELRSDGAVRCLPTETKTCDRFAGESYNCTCERGSSLSEMLDPY